MNALHRRSFLKTSGLTILPSLFPFTNVIGGGHHKPGDERPVNFWGDGMMFNPSEYITKLQEINTALPIKGDRYGAGGEVEELEKKFVEITGKEKAIYMPSGTMANQLAIKVLSGDNVKVFVQETSHVYRDEADAAQLVHDKRLIPLAKGEPYFTAEELDASIAYHKSGEHFNTGIGAVSIEVPVRRNDGRMIPFEELKRVSAYCRKQNIKLHLDGARLYMASAWSGVPIKEYASLFDTVYISLYKYFGASAGAILCGNASVIEKMPNLIKVHGGSMYQNWVNAVIPLQVMKGFEERLLAARKKGEELITRLNKLTQIKINALKDGTNIYEMKLTGIDMDKFVQSLAAANIRLPKNGTFSINETLLNRDNDILFDAFKKGIAKA